MKKLVLAALAIIGGMVIGLAPSASAIPPASFTCVWSADHSSQLPHGSWEVLYAEYDQITTEYVRAACWLHWAGSGPSVNCSFYAKYYADGHVGTPTNLNC